VHPGDWKKPEADQQPKKIPAPRIGAKIVQTDPNTLLIQNGHDNENEKQGDLWKFDLKARTWTQIEQRGDVPSGRTGHTLIHHRGFLIMYGGILEVTKETDDIYALHLGSMTWARVITTGGPCNLNRLFARSEKDQVKVPPLKGAAGARNDVQLHAKGASTDRTDFLAEQTKYATLSAGPEARSTEHVAVTAPTDPGMQSTLSGGVKGGRRRKGSVHSMPRPRDSSKGRSLFGGGRRTSMPNPRFGILPVVTAEAKAQIRKEQVQRLRAQYLKIDDRNTLQTSKGLRESPTSMKMVNTFLLKNNNPSFDAYAAQMKKRKAQVFRGRTRADLSEIGADEKSISGMQDLEDANVTKINQCQVPPARDGHSSLVYENVLIIFGGDRHHMPFNDLFMLDLDDYFFAEDA
jgi:hypothetical protein